MNVLQKVIAPRRSIHRQPFSTPTPRTTRPAFSALLRPSAGSILGLMLAVALPVQAGKTATNVTTITNRLDPAAGGGAGKNPGALPEAPSAPKDPLAYRMFQWPGGTIAQFDNWKYGPISSAANVVWCDGWPEGRQQDFILRTAIGTPSAQDLTNFFTLGPQLVQGILQQYFGPVFQRAGEPKQTTCGGDAAMLEAYQADIRGAKWLCRVLYVKRKDIAIAVLGIGKEEAFKEFGRSIELVAQSISIKESAVDAALVGTWVLETSSSAGSRVNGDVLNVAQARSITIFPNGTFTDTASSTFSGQDMTGLAEGGHRGTVVKHGNVLTFRYDNGNTWSPAYEVYSNGLKLNGAIYVKQ
jgi:hypothetical protein